MKHFSIYLLVTLFNVCAIFASNKTNDTEDMLAQSHLPARARLFLKSDFDHLKLISIIEEKRSNNFIVTTEDGMRFEFDEDGQWLDVNCNAHPVPTFIIPSKIKQIIGDGTKIMQIRRYGKNRFEIRLSNSTTIRFDKDFRMITSHK